MLESAPISPLSVDGDSQHPEDEPSGEPGDFSGTWTGRALQSGKSWPMSVTFEKARGASMVAHVSYTDRRCRADWALHGTDARHWQGDENVHTDPFSRCPNHGKVTIDLIDDDTISWRWNGSGGSASATLERSETAQP